MCLHSASFAKGGVEKFYDFRCVCGPVGAVNARAIAPQTIDELKPRGQLIRLPLLPDDGTSASSFVRFFELPLQFSTKRASAIFIFIDSILDLFDH